MTIKTTKKARSAMPILRRALAACALAAALTAGLAGSALADDFGVHDFTVTSSTTQAGAHPDLTTSFGLNTRTDPALGQIPSEALKTVKLSLPAGLIGDTVHAPQCRPDDFLNGSCPADTQVGTFHADADLFGVGDPSGLFGLDSPVWNIAQGEDRPAAFGFKLLSPVLSVGFGVRTATDAGLDADIEGVPQGGRVWDQQLTLWGVPADHLAGQGVTTPRVPLLRNPTSCGSVTTRLSVTSWEHPDRVVTAEAPSPATTGCGAVPFAPSLTVAPDADADADAGAADAPTGLDVTVNATQNRDPDGLGAADLRKAVVTLPEGYTISPSAADGLQLCTAEQAGVGSDAPGTCPDASKIGTATIDSPIVKDPLTGAIALGPSPTPGTYTLFVEVAADGVRLKLPATIDADPKTGQLTTTFDDAPQQPFTAFSLHFDGGPRAVLAAPTTCGTRTATATFTPWSSDGDASAVQRSADVSLGGAGAGCPAGEPFVPAVSAGMSGLQAGGTGAFSLSAARADGTQPIKAINSVTLPAGLVARVGTVPLCSAAAAAAGTCAETSRVGSVAVVAGPGDHPLHLSGGAYLTGGYAGAPYGLSLVVHALAGPFDLGTVVVRSGITVGRKDARITVKTDALPTILAGIPLRLRSIGLTLDRPGFMINPTSCGDAVVSVSLTGTNGGDATTSSRFGVSGCRALGLQPKAATTVTKSTKNAGAGLHVTIAPRVGDANLRAVQVALPSELTIKLKALGVSCTPAQLAADACPAASQVGGASAATPILAEPLKGPVYLVQNGSRLPSLVAVLHGGGLAIELDGVTGATKGGRLTTAFYGIPDVPLTRFDLDLPHGRRSILQTNRFPCSGAALGVTFGGQNGATLSRRVPVTVRGCRPS